MFSKMHMELMHVLAVNIVRYVLILCKKARFALCTKSSSVLKVSETTFTGCWHILKMVKNMTVAKIVLVFTRCRNNLRTVRKLTVKKSLRDFDAKEMYLHLKN